MAKPPPARIASNDIAFGTPLLLLAMTTPLFQEMGDFTAPKSEMPKLSRYIENRVLFDKDATGSNETWSHCGKRPAGIKKVAA